VDQLAGKTAVITGGSEGIGLAIARRFVAEGAYVYITGRRPAALERAAELIGPDQVTGVPGDAARPADLDRLARLGVEEALAKAGAEAGDTVLIGDYDDAVVFDWAPELPAGGGHAAGPRGSDWRLER